jgi:hypothetical protein
MVLKKKIILIGLFMFFISSTILGQKKYYDLDIEKADTIGKKIIQWKYQSLGTEFYVDSTTKFAGKNSIFVNLKQTDISGGVPFYFIFPKIFYPALRSINISVDIMFRNDKPNAGLWCLVKKDNELLGSSSTLKGNIPITVVPYTATAGNNVPVIPYSWTPYSFTIKFDKDPNQVIIGLILLKDRAWFDNLEININGKRLNKLVFAFSANN